MGVKGFLDFDNRYVITAKLGMETPLSVGSRVSLLPSGSDFPVIKTPEGLPFIPGSSLKGVIRAHTEQLLRTLDAIGHKWGGERIWACDPLDEKGRCVVATCCKDCGNCNGSGCCTDCNRCKACMVKRAQRTGTFDDKAFTEELFSHSCTACRLFGSPWLASRVHFQDAMLVNGEALPRLIEVRDGVGIDRDLGTAKPKVKFDFEVVPAGAEFGLRILVENAEEWEIGLLLLVLRTVERGELPVGGKTTRGLGWAKLCDLKVECVTRDNLLDYLKHGVTSVISPQDLVSAFTQGLSRGGDGGA